MTATIAAVTGSNGSFSPGRSQQRHLIYATNAGVYWYFWIDPATPSTLRCAYSSDLATWTTSTTLSLPYNLMGGNETQADGTADGRNFGLVYENNSGTDVVHIAAGLLISAATSWGLYDIRATVTANSISWGTPVQALTSTNVWSPDGTAPAIAADGSYLINSCIPRYAGHGNGNPTGAYNATTDTTATWTPGTWSQYSLEVAASTVTSHAAHELGGGSVLWLYDNGSANGSSTNVRWAKADISGTTPTPADVFPTTVSIDDNDWASVRVSNTDIHTVRRTGSNTYEHRRFNGTSWSAGQAVTNQTSLSGAGVCLTSDGTNVYLFVIDSAAGSAIQYCVWNGTSWGSWTTLVGTSATRTSLTTSQAASGANYIGVCWAEGSTSPYNITVAALSIATLRSLMTQARAVFAIQTSLATRARSAFSIQTALKALLRDSFVVRTALDSTARATFQTRTALLGQARGTFPIRTSLTAQARTAFAVSKSLYAAARTTFKVATSLKALAESIFKISGNVPTPGPLAARFTSTARLASTFVDQPRLAIGWAQTARLHAAFARSFPMAQPNSTTDVTATITLPDSTFPTVSTITVAVSFPDGSTSNYSLAGGAVVSLGSGKYKLTYTTKGPGVHFELWTVTASDGSVGQFINQTGASY